MDWGRFQSRVEPSPLLVTRGVGRNGSRCAFTPTGPAPGPPPPWGVVNVLWRLKWQTSKPKSPGRVIPRIAFRLAPSMYTCAPLAWHISLISRIRGSKSPRVFGTVIMGAGGRLKGDGVHASDLSQVPAELPHQLKGSLEVSLRGERVEPREAPEP